LITFPLTVVGGIVGKNAATEFDAPCRTKLIPNKIPELPWYRRAVVQMVMAGFLPFSAIYIEIYYIFASVWGHKIYTVYSILFIVFIILTVVTSFITIALTYFQLAVEDHEWCAWPATCHKDTSQATFTLRLTNAHSQVVAGGDEWRVREHVQSFVRCNKLTRTMPHTVQVHWRVHLCVQFFLLLVPIGNGWLPARGLLFWVHGKAHLLSLSRA
jgi:hypothetical protein